MATVQMTIVGFEEKIDHVQLMIDGDKPTIKTALEELRDDRRIDLFDFEQKVEVMSTNFLLQLRTRLGDVHAMCYRGQRLSPVEVESYPTHGHGWTFCVLRQVDRKKVLLDNRAVPFDRFEIEDGDEIFWSLVGAARQSLSTSIRERGFDENDRLVAV
jgi:hypothetical protein